MTRILVLLVALLLPGIGAAETIILASTTSTQNSGLLDAILPQFTTDTGVEVRVVAVGTGQAMRIGQNGDADVLLVHHRPSELEFVAAGDGIDRRDVMFNDFVVIGPSDDPAAVRAAITAPEALLAVATAQARFVSRGDHSGTHYRELDIWALAGNPPLGPWYNEIGAGMGAALNFAAAINGYILSDRGTWLNFANRGDLAVLFSGDPVLHNPYSVIRVNPEKHPNVRAEGAKIFADWLVGQKGQAAIASYRIDGLNVFCPAALPPEGVQSHQDENACTSGQPETQPESENLD